jgi:hypothetical protein
MNAFLNRYATPLTLGLFAVSTVSGVALFLHVGQSYFHVMHEWLSIVLLVPFVLHVWKNWSPMVLYWRRGAFLTPVLASLAAAVLFAWLGHAGVQQGVSPAVLAGVLTRAPLVDLAPVLKTTPDALQAALVAKGYTVASTQDSLAKIAGPEARKALAAVLPQGK